MKRIYSDTLPRWSKTVKQSSVFSSPSMLRQPILKPLPNPELLKHHVIKNWKWGFPNQIKINILKPLIFLRFLRGVWGEKVGLTPRIPRAPLRLSLQSPSAKASSNQRSELEPSHGVDGWMKLYDAGGVWICRGSRNEELSLKPCWNKCYL